MHRCRKNRVLDTCTPATCPFSFSLPYLYTWYTHPSNTLSSLVPSHRRTYIHRTALSSLFLCPYTAAPVGDPWTMSTERKACSVDLSARRTWGVFGPAYARARACGADADAPTSCVNERASERATSERERGTWNGEKRQTREHLQKNTYRAGIDSEVHKGVCVEGR